MISTFQFQPGGSAVESARIGADYIHRSGAQHIGCIRSEVHQGAHKGEWKTSVNLMSLVGNYLRIKSLYEFNYLIHLSFCVKLNENIKLNLVN